MKWLLLPALLLAAPVPAAHASGIANLIPWGVDAYGGNAAEQDDFYDGRVGVLMGGSPWARLFAGWRMLNRLPVGAELGKTLSEPCCDQPTKALGASVARWNAVRASVPGPPAKPVNDYDAYRSVGDFSSVQTCFADAFDTAAATLTARISAHGLNDPWVKAWADAQDAVFAACHDEAALPSVGAGAPRWVMQDWAYQSAAAQMYARHFPEAGQQFAAIARDATSPWQKFAPFLEARAAVTAALPTKDEALLSDARSKLAALSADGVYGHDDAVLLSHALDFRTQPDRRRQELITELSGIALPSSAAADFKDSRRLGGAPGADYPDWLAVFGRKPDTPKGFLFDHYDIEKLWGTDADALAHARARWAATRSAAWLLAVMQASSPGPDAADAVAASRGLPPGDPAWLTAAFHRIRLTLAADPAAARSELDPILARSDLSTTSRNLFLAERSMVAAGLEDFAQAAVRQSPCVTARGQINGCVGEDFQMESYDQNNPGPRLGDEAVKTIDRMPLALRAALAADRSLPDKLRLDIALTTWVRAALLQDWATADRMAATLMPLMPLLNQELAGFLAAKPGDDKRFAAWFILAKVPRASVDISAGYTRPEGAVSDWSGSWRDWLYLPAGTEAPAGTLSAPPTADGDLICYGLCGQAAPVFRLPDFVAAGSPEAGKERAKFDLSAPAPVTPGSPPLLSVWDAVIAYAQAHKNDRRSPEALFWLVRVSRYGHGHNRSSFRAFKLLHARYPDTAWAKQTKYYYD